MRTVSRRREDFSRIDPKPRGAVEVRLLDAPGAGYGCAVIRPAAPCVCGREAKRTKAPSLAGGWPFTRAEPCCN